MKLIDDAYKQFHRLWSVQGSLFFAVLNGALVGLSAFSDKIDPWLFMKLNVVGYLTIAALRLFKQKPHPDVPSSLPATAPAPAMPWAGQAPMPPVSPPIAEPEAQEILAALKELIKQHPGAL
jgi:hypothetical protein